MKTNKDDALVQKATDIRTYREIMTQKQEQRINLAEKFNQIWKRWVEKGEENEV